MTGRQKIELRASDIRKRLSEIADIPELTEDVMKELGELRSEYQALELRMQAAILAEDKLAEEKPAEEKPAEPSREEREFNELLMNADIGTLYADILQQRQTPGEMAELQQHFNLSANQVPLELLDLEQRAVTPAPTSVGSNLHPIQPYVFPRSAAAFLGVRMPTVPVGAATFPVLTGNPTVSTPSENTAVTETTGSFTSDALAPRRAQASYFYSREDRAAFRGMGEALRQALREGLSDGVDDFILTNSTHGFEGALTNPTNPTAVVTYANVLGWMLDNVDGRYAQTPKDTRFVMANDVYKKIGTLWRGNNDNVSALTNLMSMSGGVRVSAHSTAAPSTGGNQNIGTIIGAKSMTQGAVAPMWQGVTLIPDEITKAANGQIVITAVLLFAFKITRKEQFMRIEAKIA